MRPHPCGGECVAASTDFRQKSDSEVKQTDKANLGDIKYILGTEGNLEPVTRMLSIAKILMWMMHVLTNTKIIPTI
jgi:hypothetical protein